MRIFEHKENKSKKIVTDERKIKKLLEDENYKEIKPKKKVVKDGLLSDELGTNINNDK